MPFALSWTYLLLATALAGAVLAWCGQAYWNYSDGVYLLTSRTLGDGLYTDIAAAQPPALYWIGGAILAVHDSLLAVRLVLTVVSVVTGLLVASAVWRLTGSRRGALIAGVAALIAPWHLHESLTLTPETLGGPLLLGAALATGGPARRSALGGVAAGIAISLKVVFAAPVVALLIGTTSRARFAAGAAVTVAVTAAVALYLYGEALIDNVFTAQAQTGTRGFGVVAPLAVQAAWNLLPLLVPAGLGVLSRHRFRDPALAMALGALLAGELLLVPTVLKTGTSLNMLAVIEPAAIAIGASYVVVLLGRTAEHDRTRRRVTLSAMGACVVVVALQSASLVLSPDLPRLFDRPFSAPAYQRKLSNDEVERAAAHARTCGAGSAYSGQPFIAFVADREMPAEQADPFILANAEVHAGRARAASEDRVRCP